MGTEHIEVTTLTFQAIGLGMGHFLLVVLWKSLSPTVSEIFRPKHQRAILRENRLGGLASGAVGEAKSERKSREAH